MTYRSDTVLGCLIVGSLLATASCRDTATQAPLAQADVIERLGEQVPLEVRVRDAQGHVAPLGDFVGSVPAVLILGYYHCEMLCGLVFEAAAAAMGSLDGPGTGAYRAISLSIDPSDGPASARHRQQPLLDRLGWAASRWPFLTASEQDVSRVADRIGFQYRYDAGSDQYAHPAVLTILTPGGRVASYLYGVEFDPARLERALEEARAGHALSPVRRLLLRCFHYVPALRKYEDALGHFFRLGGLATLAALLLGFRWVRRQERARRSS